MAKTEKLSVSIPPELDFRLKQAHKSSGIGTFSSYIQFLLVDGLRVEEAKNEHIKRFGTSEARRTNAQ